MSTFQRRRITAALAAVTAACLGVSLLQAQPSTATPVQGQRQLSSTFPKPDLGEKVSGIHAAAIAHPITPATSATPRPGLPLPSGSYSLALPAAPVMRAARSATGSTSRATARAVAPAVTGAWKALGGTGISVAATGTAATTATVSVLTPAQVRARGLSGLVLRIAEPHATGRSALAVKVPAALLNRAYGADFAARVRWTQVPDTARAGTARGTRVAASTAGGASIATPTVSSAAVLMTAAGAPVSATGTGTFSATPLKASDSWAVSAQTGDFAWNYPLRTPPAAAGPSPSLALNYDSQSIDGETGSTNNQPSAIGDGWSLAGGGYIERSYVSCSLDTGPSGPVASSGDLCWKRDNATVSFGGHAGQLIKDSTSGIWKLQADDGSRIDYLTGTTNGTYDGDYWRITTLDGTQYYFGMNRLPGWASGNPTTNSAWTVPVYGNDTGEPCHGATFAASVCTQAWRWNLDYVVDPHANAEALYYDTETNSYAQNGGSPVSYIRGGQLDHIDYGLRAGSVYAANAASDKVVFGYDAYGRCSDATHANCTSEPITSAATAPAHPTSYPDVPFDQYCTGATCTQLSPTFFTTAMLDTVTTQDLVGTAYANVDQWSLAHSFPDPGDGTSAALWLTQVTHTGTVGGSIAEPPTVFTGAALQNRVWAVDGLAPLEKYRITSLTTSLGEILSINYSAPQCTPSNAAAIEAAVNTNTNRCFPQWWVPQVTPPQPAQEDLFHKYVVTSVIENPATGGANDLSKETDYVYTGTPAWRYDRSPFTPENDRTWSDYAGYSSVEIRVGDHNTPTLQQTTDYTFFQGMNGDRASTSGGTKTVNVIASDNSSIADSLWLAGRTREVKTLLGVGGAIESDTITTPWVSATTSNDGITEAHIVNDSDVKTTSPVSTGGNRTVDTSTTYNAYGLPVQVNAATSDAATTCTTTTYAMNTSTGLIDYPSEVAKVGVACSAAPSATYPGAAISDVRTSYDSGAWAAAPTKGDITQTAKVKSYIGTTAATAVWLTTGTATYDTLGRVLTATDPTTGTARTTTTSYTPTGSGPLTSTTVTNALGWATTSAFNPAWGAPTSVTDQNSHLTTATYDALGRRTQVWLPDRPQASNASSPSLAYSYTLSTTAPSTVATTTQTAGGPVTSYALYDGLGRPRQTQAPSDAGASSVVTDTFYNAAGQVGSTYPDYWAVSTNPSTTLFNPQTSIPLQESFTYDGLGRTTADIQIVNGTEVWRTSTSYPGMDRTDTTPPTGGTPTSSITNSLGEQTSLTQYLSSTPGTGIAEKTSYGYDPRGDKTSMTDAAGNHWSWTFDVLDRQTSATDPDTGTTTTSYDDAARVTTTTDANNNTLAYTYNNLDPANRETGEYSGSTSGPEIASWTYDSPDKGQTATATRYVGSVAGTPGAAFTQSYLTYDARDRVTTQKTTIPTITGAPTSQNALAGSYTTKYAYGPNGELTAQQDPAEGPLTTAETLRYGYTIQGHFGVLSGTKNYISGVSYTGAGLLAQYSTYQGQASWAETLYYTPGTNRLSRSITTAQLNTTTTTPADRTYAYTNAGDTTSISDQPSTGATDTQCFTYDPQQQLTAAWTPASNSCTAAPTSTTLGGAAPYWTSYTVDPTTGNRTATTEHATSGTGTDTDDAYTYPNPGAAHPHFPISVTHTGAATSNYTVNPDGSTATRPGQNLTYDATGALTSLTNTTSGQSQTSIYDATGALLIQTDPATGSTAYLGDTELHAAAGSTTLTATRTYTALGRAVAEQTTPGGTPTTTWLSDTTNGTATTEINGTTAATTTRYLDPYGNPRGSTPPWTSTHGYLNAPTSSFSGLTHLGARNYDPTTGRFTTVDPILAPTDIQSLSGYAYSGNDPINKTDPTGLRNDQQWYGPTGSPTQSNQTGDASGPPDNGTPPPPAGGGGGDWGAPSHPISIWSLPGGPGAYGRFGYKSREAIVKSALSAVAGAEADCNSSFPSFPGMPNAMGNLCNAAVSVVAMMPLAPAGALGGLDWGATAPAADSVPDLTIDDAQFGAKVGKHAQDYGLNPSDPAARTWIRSHVEDIVNNPDGVRQGAWNPKGGGGSDYWFFQQGSDVVVTRGGGQFVTILKGGVSNGWFKDATPK